MVETAPARWVAEASVADLGQRVAECLASVAVGEETRRRATKALCLWLEGPSYRAHRESLEHALAAGHGDELVDAFRTNVSFGTGGVRATVGPGPNRLNRATVARIVRGHATSLPAGSRVLVAWDVRCFRDQRGLWGGDSPLLGWTSQDIARFAGAIYREAGHDPLVARRLFATPQLSFAVRALEGAGGLYVSASHNPPDDNGLKIYDEAGAQLLPPAGAHIAALASDGPMPVAWEAPAIPDDVLEQWAEVAAGGRTVSTSVFYSPLHGAGIACVPRVLEQVGAEVVIDPVTADPDGAFPTLPDGIANPEQAEVLSGAIARAEEAGLALVLGTDPDADRIGAAYRRRSGEWSVLNGQQIATLVVDELLRGAAPSAEVVTTVVTTRQISRLAEAAGVRVTADLPVGFKFIAAHLAREPERFLVGVEESHGVLTTPAIRDKCAGCGAVALAAAHARCVADEMDLGMRLAEIAARVGPAVCRQVSVRLEGAVGALKMAQFPALLRRSPPEWVGTWKVHTVRDLLTEVPPGASALGRELFVLGLDCGRLCLRPSGTEPKLKVYVEVWEAGAASSVEVMADALAEAAREWLVGALDSVVVTAAVPE